MPLFEYQAVNSKGKNVKGKIDASNDKQALTQLRQQALLPLKIKELRKKSTGGLSADFQLPKFLQPSIPAKVITEFFRQFAVLAKTGIPYDRGLDIILQETQLQSFQNVLSDIKSLVVEGSSMANAMEKHSDLFPSMVVSMIRAGEAGGILDKVLLRLVMYREKQEKLKGKIQTALIYPSIMSLLGVGIVVFMVTFILPKIIPVFEDFGVELPLPTQIVIFLSDLLTDYGLIILAIFISVVVGIKKFISTSRGKKIYDQFLLKIPVLNTLLTKIIVYRFTQSLGTLMESGVDIRKSLFIINHVAGNYVFEKAIEEMSEDITKKGYSLSQAMKKSGQFSGSIVQMIRVGEEGNSLENMLIQISEEAEREVNNTLERFVTLLEPLIIMFMAVGVGFIVVSILLPMFAMNDFI